MFTLVTAERFSAHFNRARRESSLIREATSALESFDPHTLYFLSGDGRSGFAITRPDQRLVYVFSLERGRGPSIVETAIANGALHLDCFDGYLVDFYKRHGFRETNRETNWTPGGPDVVFMTVRATVWRQKRYPVLTSSLP